MREYLQNVKVQRWRNFLLFLFMMLVFLLAMGTGSAGLPLKEGFLFLVGKLDNASHRLIWELRLLRAITAVIVGAALAAAGAVMQCVLENPLASPFTMGISQGAAFGAAFSIVVLKAGQVHNGFSDAVAISDPYRTTVFAFGGALLGVFVVLILAKIRGLSPQAIILAGIAMSFLFMAGLTLLQFLASDQELAAIVFWTFGDLGRATWREVGIMAWVVFPVLSYFYLQRWNYNALLSGEEASKALGVNTELVRLLGVFLSSLVAAVSVAFVGIIGFVGLLGPHMMRGVVGSDHGFLLPASVFWGASILLLSDSLARLLLSPVVLPVGIITSFLGAPLFVYILTRKNR